MGCAQSMPTRTTRRRRRKRRIGQDNESKEMRQSRRAKGSIAATTFVSDKSQFVAPDKNYRSEYYIDQTTEFPEKLVVPNFKYKQATYTGIYNMRIHHADRDECRIKGAEFLPNGTLIVCDQANQSLKLWSATFQYLNHFKLPGNPHDLCVYSSNKDGSDIYVTIPSNRTIMEFYVEEHIIVPGQNIRTDGWCYGIAPYKTGLIVSVGTKIEFIDTDGNILKTLQYDTSGRSKFGNPFYLAVTEANNIVVSDALKGCVMCITPDGEDIFRYEDMGFPRRLTTDKEENIYICGNESGATDIVHQVSIRGEKVKSLLSWRHVGFTPDAICFRGKDKLLAVCGENDRIKTFRLDQRKSGKVFSNDAIMDSNRIQTERSTQEVQELMRRILLS